MTFSASNRMSCATKTLCAPNASVGTGTWHPSKAPGYDKSATPPGLYLPGPSVAVGCPLRRWLHTPPFGEFEQVVLYRYGPAQVGLDQHDTSCAGLVAPFMTEPTMPAAHTVPKRREGTQFPEAPAFESWAPKLEPGCEENAMETRPGVTSPLPRTGGFFLRALSKIFQVRDGSRECGYGPKTSRASKTGPSTQTRRMAAPVAVVTGTVHPAQAPIPQAMNSSRQT